MNFNRAQAVDEQFQQFCQDPGEVRPADQPLPMPKQLLLDMFESQLLCRQLDLAARELKAHDQSYYTIASAGHEGNVVLGEVLRRDDPALLHYRSGALMLQRYRKQDERDPVEDVLLSLMASKDDPIAGGRHKVWGSKELWVPPQTSTIASHLPKALGTALALERGHRLKLDMPVPKDAIVCCSFGDASVNHSTAQGALNATAWTAYQRLPLPLLFVCEDNGLGISVPTPPGWIEASMRSREGIAYVQADGLDLVQCYSAVRHAVSLCRTKRQPVFLHLSVTRLLGHAGSDIEQEYRSQAEIAAVEQQDPLLGTARLVLSHGLLEPKQLLERYEAARARVRDTAAKLKDRPKLTTATEVMACQGPTDEAEIAAQLSRPLSKALPPAPKGRQRHLAGNMNRALHEAMTRYPEAMVFGEDVARKGGVYHVTAKLWKNFGAGRVFNTLLDEQQILGLAIGAGHMGLLPIPEIQYLAYLHNAEDQLRGEACSLQFFSQDQFRNPMVVRIASYAYQRGFGGHFHNDNSIAVLRDMPSLVIASPSRGDDAVQMFRTCLALARGCGRVVAFLEPIALYMTKDLHEEGDEGWLCDYPEEGAVPLGEGRGYDEFTGEGGESELTIVSYANGLYMSLQAAKELAAQGVRTRVLDLRWLAPLPLEWVAEHARASGKLLVVDECRRSGGLGEAVMAGVAERAPKVESALVAAEDCFIPLGPAMYEVLPSKEGIRDAALALCGKDVSGKAKA
ncbi:MAG TPA: MFS transporter [Planctomycetes bacterium]|nr:MFS transporter [Planctomycetota bacterium]